jgi:hypothetical protein
MIKRKKETTYLLYIFLLDFIWYWSIHVTKWPPMFTFTLKIYMTSWFSMTLTTCQLILFQACGQHFFLRLLINKQHLCFVKLRGRAVAEAEKLKYSCYEMTSNVYIYFENIYDVMIFYDIKVPKSQTIFASF